MKLIKLLLLTLAIIPQLSVADNAKNNSTKNQTFYFGFGVGHSDLNRPDDSIREYDNKLILQAGYRRSFNQYFAIDTRIFRNSESELSTVADSRDLNIDFTGLVIAARSQLVIIDWLTVFGNLGVNNYQWHYDGFRVIEGDILVDDRKKQSGNKLFYSAGLKFDFSNFGISLEHQWLDMNGLDLSTNSISLEYRF